MILTIKGSDIKVKQLARELKVRARRNGLVLLLGNKEPNEDLTEQLTELSEQLELKTNEAIELVDSKTELESDLEEVNIKLTESDEMLKTKSSEVEDLKESSEELNAKLSEVAKTLEIKSEELEAATEDVHTLKADSDKTIAKLEKDLKAAKKVK
jgi:predicted nuclease with TOPRIM domain